MNLTERRLLRNEVSVPPRRRIRRNARVEVDVISDTQYRREQLTRMGVVPTEAEETAMLFLEGRGKQFGIHFGYLNARAEARSLASDDEELPNWLSYTECGWNALLDRRIKAEVAKRDKRSKAGSA